MIIEHEQLNRLLSRALGIPLVLKDLDQLHLDEKNTRQMLIYGLYLTDKTTRIKGYYLNNKDMVFFHGDI